MHDSRLRWRELLPIVGRELRVAAKRRMTYWMRWIVALLGGMEVLLTTQLAGATVEAGQFVFWCTSILMLMICGGAGLLLTADSISREKREGTLGLLFLTRLVPADVVLGKLAVGALNGCGVAFAGLPFLAFSLCLGGVTAEEFWGMSGALVFIFAYSLVTGIFISTLFRKEGVVGIVFCMVIIAPLAATPLAWMKWAAIPEWLAKLNVFYPAMSVMDSDEKYLTAAMARAVLWRQTMAMAAMLALCFFALPLTLRPHGSGAREKLRASSRRFLPADNVGDRDPILWLGRRNGHSLALLGICVCMYLAVRFAAAPASSAEVVFAVLMTLLPKLFILWKASGGMAIERQSGFLETLLTTPVSRGEVLVGKMRAIRRQVWPALIFALVALWHIATKWWGAQGEITLGATLTLAAMISLLIDVHAIGWIGLWQGLVAGDRRRALVWAALWGVIGPWMPAGLAYMLIGFLINDMAWVGQPVSFVAPAMISANVISFALACFAMARLHEKFRATATATWTKPKKA